jgi:hypothetical protein
MPLPPEDVAESSENSEPELEFTKVECLLMALHSLGKQAPQFLVDNADQTKDFRVGAAGRVVEDETKVSIPEFSGFFIHFRGIPNISGFPEIRIGI